VLAVTDEMGNRNNHLSVPLGKQDDTDQDLSSNNITGAADRIAVPFTVLEKADNDLKHGDDFGVKATASQKVAHEKRSADAGPDYVVVHDQNPTDGPGNAAEVADSAALLDKEASTPTVPDDEAGRIGLRRLSTTPIRDVARVAAEVAQSAASLDLDYEDERYGKVCTFVIHSGCSSSG